MPPGSPSAQRLSPRFPQAACHRLVSAHAFKEVAWLQGRPFACVSPSRPPVSPHVSPVAAAPELCTRMRLPALYRPAVSSPTPRLPPDAATPATSHRIDSLLALLVFRYFLRHVSWPVLLAAALPRFCLPYCSAVIRPCRLLHFYQRSLLFLPATFFTPADAVCKRSFHFSEAPFHVFLLASSSHQFHLPMLREVKPRRLAAFSVRVMMFLRHCFAEAVDRFRHTLDLLPRLMLPFDATAPPVWQPECRFGASSLMLLLPSRLRSSYYHAAITTCLFYVSLP